MPKLFETTYIKGMKLSNRFIRSATWEGMATDEGACTPQLIDFVVRLAKGGVGLIITSHAYVRREGQAGPWQLGVYDDSLVEGLQDMARAVHEEGGRIVLQIAHAGIFARPELTGEQPVAFSKVEGFVKTTPKVMSKENIREIVDAFSKAALRAKKAGFDGVQIHAAHGYLLSQSLSPLFNKRRDAYGGSLEKRARMLREVVESVRGAVGEDFAVLIKMNTQDYLQGGLSLNASVKVGAMLEEEGIDLIELSGGTLVSGKLNPSRPDIKSQEREAYFKEGAEAFKKVLQIPIALVGGIRSFDVAEELVVNNVADYVSMSRPLIREPDLVKRWASGDLRRARCISDNRCFGPARAGKGLYCVTEAKEKVAP